MAKKSKTVNEISHEEVNDALSRFLKKGGVIKKVEYNDNGFLLNNDLALDDNYTEATDGILNQLNVDFEPENRIWLKACSHIFSNRTDSKISVSPKKSSDFHLITVEREY